MSVSSLSVFREGGVSILRLYLEKGDNELKFERKLNLMKQSLEKNTLMIALITGSVIWGGTSGYAEESEQVFTLDPMIVTAQGFETKDLDTPAAVEVYDVKRITHLTCYRIP